MGHTKRKFTIKLNPAIIKVARMALVHANVETKGMPSLSDLKTSPGITGRLSIDMDEAAVLQGVLRMYAAQEVREGSESYKVAMHFAAALGDYVGTKPPEVEKVRYTPPVVTPNAKTVGGPIPVSQELERRLDARRDEIFRHIIGTPADTTIWGTPRLKEEPRTPKKGRIPANLQPHRVRTLDGVLRDGPRQRLASVADESVNDVLTQGRVPAYNEQMKREGAEELINASQNRGANQQGIVVGQVPSVAASTAAEEEGVFRKLLQEAQNGGSQAEIEMLSSLWATT